MKQIIECPQCNSIRLKLIRQYGNELFDYSCKHCFNTFSFNKKAYELLQIINQLNDRIKIQAQIIESYKLKLK